jgi:hypothetical protein
MPKTSLSPAVATVAKTIARAEWDFSQCPDDRAYLCYTYEYGRQIPEIRERFLHDQVHNPAAFDPQETWHHVVVSEMPTGSLRVSDPETPEEAERLNKTPYLEVIDAPMGFPDKPYLQTTHCVTVESYSPFVIGLEPLRPAIQKADGGWQADDLYHPDNLREDEVAHFAIDRRSSDNALLKHFAQWLEKTRGGRKSIELRGKNQVTRCLADLKALGAARLVNHFGTAVAAQNYTASLGCNNYQGLYVGLGDWTEAKDRVNAVIARWLRP